MMIGEHGAKEYRFNILMVDAMKESGHAPVEFEKPIKVVRALIRLEKRIEPSDFSERHQAVGWCLGTLIDKYNKELFNVQSLTMRNEEDAVTVEAVVNIGYATFEDDHVAWLDNIIAGMTGEDEMWPACGWCYRRKYWKWDSAERISDVFCLEQKIGDQTQ